MEYLIIIGLFIGSNLCTAFFSIKSNDRKWRAEVKDHALKVIKKARKVEKEYKDADIDTIWDELADGKWMR